MLTKFGRLITAMATPFDKENQVSLTEAKKLAQYLIDNGSTTLLLAGTTGESPTLSHEEEFALFDEITTAFGDKACIMANTGSNSTKTAISSTQEAEKIGVHASLQVVPYYNKPSQEGLYRHFRSIAGNTSLPIMIYNIPGRTGTNLEPETMARLADITNIVAVKESAGSVDQMKKIRELTRDDFLIYSGDDGLTLDFMKEGACGVVSVASHFVGKQIRQMIDAYLAGNISESEKINEKLISLMEVLFITSNPTPLKAGLNMIGFEVGHPRLPLIEATQDEKDKVRVVLAEMGLV